MSGALVTFRIGDTHYAVPLTSVREVVRLSGLRRVPGASPPLVGVLDFHGGLLRVLDLRPEASTHRKDVVVFDADPGPACGLAVDEVLSVLEATGGVSPFSADGGKTGFPSYLTGVYAGPDGPLLIVDPGALTPG